MKDSNNLRIETATDADIAEIRRLAFLIWPAAYGEILAATQINYMLNLFYSEDALQKQFQSHEFLLARLGTDNCVGFASFSNTAGTNYGKLHKLYVLPGLQGQGIGKKLLDAVIAKARFMQLDAVELNVNRHNKAIAFYENYGFTKNREEDIDIGNNYWMNDFVMRFEIK